MKRFATARNRLRRESTSGASLFPFLAVLICTMGALILLLVVIARQARLQAAQESANQYADVRRKLSSAREWAQVQIDEYRYSRQATEKELATSRIELGHLEDHSRRLREQLSRLEAAWSETQSVAADASGRRDALEAELKRLQAEIAHNERDLAEAVEAGRKRGSYAVVPYEGLHSTRRRPVHIECRRDSVVLQPEGVVFGAEDFAGPLGPGNPLEVALRAIREYHIRHHPSGEADSEPYPLLLVRPDGIEAYYAARAAMKSWASDFGYELIGDDWTLQFHPPDPRMREEVTRAVATARARQEMLLAAAPGRYDGGLRRGYVASPYRGGLLAQSGAHPPEEPGYQPRQAFGRLGNQAAPGGGPDQTEPSMAGDGRFQPETIGAGGDRYQRASPARGDGPYQGEQPTPGGMAQAGMSPQGGGPHQGVSGPQGEGDQPTGSPYQGGIAGSHGEMTSQAASPGEGAAGASCPFGRPEALAKVRGRNWGLPNAAHASVPITSPIRIDCYPDRLVLVPERGLGQPRTILLGPRTEDSVDELVSNVWDYMGLWGSAGNGMYWRPVLTFHVAPNAQSRYADLEALLDESGLKVRMMNDE